MITPRSMCIAAVMRSASIQLESYQTEGRKNENLDFGTANWNLESHAAGHKLFEFIGLEEGVAKAAFIAGTEYAFGLNALTGPADMTALRRQVRPVYIVTAAEVEANMRTFTWLPCKCGDPDPPKPDSGANSVAASSAQSTNIGGGASSSGSAPSPQYMVTTGPVHQYWYGVGSSGAWSSSDETGKKVVISETDFDESSSSSQSDESYSSTESSDSSSNSSDESDGDSSDGTDSTAGSDGGSSTSGDSDASSDSDSDTNSA